MHRCVPIMTTSACLAIALLACAPGAETPGSDASSPSGETVAEVGDRAITADELDARVKDDLLRTASEDYNPAKLYDMRAAALEAMLAEAVLETEAASREVSPEELIALEITEMGPVSDDEVGAFYEENRAHLGNEPLEKLAERIRVFLEQRREFAARDRIRERANVTIHLEPPRYEVAAEGPARGPENARVTIVEFSDFQCPFCSRALPVLEQVLEKYPDDVRLVYRHLPLDRIHDRARPAAEASLCAHDQDAFWPYHDKLFENRSALQQEDLLRYAGEVGLDAERFAACLDGGEFVDEIEADLQAARAAGITGTPAFVVNGVLLTGARPAESFYQVIDAELARAEGDESP